ncbi:hypothetical protein [Tenuibacillus multivorans]|uniref:Copper amine oxidase N-terminal domain-containing protein n=1 Tax=Tenuibacillus multivorans TaxID=237069 RepID=A0A1G9YA75_9BACI|nr:hypothetical protein [Tenuibacillus multivorans]GEL75991.1 hypothetical protein TMU01_02260 [Tenuibacillus multivorans]SDN05415.1 hypothetical protein SAMN05216498_1287 [Tenuibacillus multivorans]
MRLIVMTAFMIIVSIVLGAYQWLDYQSSQVDHQQQQQPTINIELKENESQLSVQVLIEHLPSDTYTINQPEHAKHFTCNLSEGQVCLEDENQLKLEQKQVVILSYHLPLQNEEINYFLSWLPEVYDKDGLIKTPVKTTLTSPSGVNSHWFTHQQPTFSETLDHIRYQEWTFQSDTDIPLVNIKGQYDSYSLNDRVNLVSSIPIKLQPFNDLLNRGFQDVRQIFIVSPKLDPLKLESLSVLNSSEKRHIVSSLLTSKLLSLTDEKEESGLLLDVVNAYFFTTDLQTSKGKQMLESLRQSVTGNKKDEWLDELLNLDQSDNHLANILEQSLLPLDIHTNFFTLNHSKEKFTPFYGMDQRIITLNQKPVDQEWQGIIYEKQSYLPLESLIEITGMTLTKTNDEELLVHDGTNRFRFYPERDLYIINEANYQIDEQLLVDINNKLYINTSLASQIFPFSIDVGQNNININQ